MTFDEQRDAEPEAPDVSEPAPGRRKPGPPKMYGPPKRRRRPRQRPRSVTLPVRRGRGTGRAKAYAALWDVPVDATTTLKRPATRGDCVEGPRPCPWASCKFHLYIDVLDNGALKFNFPDLESWELRETCALDVADRGGITLEEVGDLSNITRERVRQIEVRAFLKLKAMSPTPDELAAAPPDGQEINE